MPAAHACGHGVLDIHPEVRKADLSPIGRYVIDAVTAALRAEGLPDDALGALDPDDVRLAKTASRRVLGFINDVAVHISYAPRAPRRADHADVAELNHQLQRTLHNHGGRYADPLELVHERLGRSRTSLSCPGARKPIAVRAPVPWRCLRQGGTYHRFDERLLQLIEGASRREAARKLFDVGNSIKDPTARARDRRRRDRIRRELVVVVQRGERAALAELVDAERDLCARRRRRRGTRGCGRAVDHADDRRSVVGRRAVAAGGDRAPRRRVRDRRGGRGRSRYAVSGLVSAITLAPISSCSNSRSRAASASGRSAPHATMLTVDSTPAAGSAIR